ncbi:IclR family transcriptional regulator [Oceanivirga miroungae]|uniref:DNA-binding transcriptional repressor AllR n=1 Tax=Oceanivirga miroungae TaxID=1130046 RepID=A0A6I8MBT6_9FUSO|nr:IclR family transcriptional regulator [Oceanivirga miroungae]VWL85698.1 DNA-binding transcriptional repressor AllR [Oceanivirga miroungae]
MPTLQSLDRALKVLEIISEEGEAGLTSISKKVGLNKTTTYRILVSLKDNMYIRQLKNKKYALTFKMFRLGNRAVQNFDYVAVSKRIITKLANEVEQEINFVIQDGNEIIYIDKYVPKKDKNIIKQGKIGKKAPMYCTSSGKAILAYKDQEEVKKIWDSSEIIKYTSRTITSFDTLLQDLKRIRKNGYSTEYEEYQLGVYCIGAPIKNIKGEIVGAISISIPLDDTRGKMFYVDKLKESIDKMSNIIEG